MCVLNVVMLIVVCGPEGQISELRLTKNCDAVVTLFNMLMYIHGIFFCNLAEFCWILVAS